MEKEIKKLLNSGEDYMAREDLEIRLRDLINKSGRGEVGISEYIRELEKVLNIAKEYIAEFK